MLPETFSLQCFLAVAESGSFRIAARNVSLSAAALSERIAKLEQELDAAVFLRTTRSVALTAEGLRLLPVAKECVRQAGLCSDAVHQGTRAQTLSLTLGSRFELAQSWLVPNLHRLEQAQPSRQLHLYLGDSADLFGSLQRGSVDAVVTSARLAQPRFASANLHPETYGFFGSRSLLRKNPFRKVEDATRHTLLDVDATLPLFRYFQDAAPVGTRFRFRNVQTLGGIGPVLMRVAEGVGVAVLPDYYVARSAHAKQIVRLFPALPTNSDWFRLVWRKGSAHEAVLEGLAEELRGFTLQ